MKIKYSILGAFTVLSITLASSLVMAQKVGKPKLDVKCYVELFGGGHSIYFARLSDKDYQTLPISLIDRKVYTADRKDKVSVYAVKECVLEKNKFKSSVANDLEKTMPK